jgi:GT2 family glycosyltransferase
VSLVGSTLPERPLVSLLLPVFDAGPILDHVLERLAANTTYPEIELIAVDDGSTDDSPEILRRWRDSGRFERFVLVSKENGGAIDTLNAALERATGEVVVQLDADASIETPGWLEKMLAVLRADDRVGVVTVKVVMDDGVIHACGVELTRPTGMLDRPARPTERPGARTWHSRTERVREGEWPGENRLTEVDAGMGCCLMYRRDDAIAAGGYDRGYSPVWFDDVDLCLSIRARGRKAFYLPDVRVVHHITGREAPAAPQTVAEHAKELVKRVTPDGPRRWLRRRLDPEGSYSPAQRERLQHHYAYWQQKWGWDPLNPTAEDVCARWKGTEVAWALEPERRRAGEEIVAALRERSAGTA